MSKESIRKKIDEAKEKAQKALGRKGVSPDLVIAVESLLLLIEILATLFLEKKIRKNSSNSGLPPSQNFGSNGNRNNGTNERPDKSNLIENITASETSETLTPVECLKCGEDLAPVKVVRTEERKKIDILYEVVTHTVVSEVKKCPDCGHINKRNFPKGMDGLIQYGNGIKTMIIDFLCVQMMSLQRVEEHLNGLLRRVISQAIMLKYIYQFNESLENWEKEQIENILKYKVMHCDETSSRVNKKNFWVHSYSSGDITLKFVHEERGMNAINDIDIIPRYGGVIVHDCWASYLAYDNVEHALCGSHLLRELKFIEDLNKFSWATRMKKLLQKSAIICNKRKKKRKLTESENKKLVKNYKKILQDALTEMPKFPMPTGKKGRVKHTDAQNLWLRLEKHEYSVLMFARETDVDFTNNRAERDIRVSKIKQKNSGGFRTLEMAKAFYRISSYIKTMRYKGYSSLEAISLALNGKIPA